MERAGEYITIKRNFIYFVYEKGTHRGYYVSARNWARARSLGKNKLLLTDKEIRFTACREKTGKFKHQKVVTSLPEGILTMQQLADLKLCWWNCPSCGGDNFRINGLEDQFTCQDCGSWAKIIYPKAGEKHDMS